MNQFYATAIADTAACKWNSLQQINTGWEIYCEIVQTSYLTIELLTLRKCGSVGSTSVFHFAKLSARVRSTRKGNVFSLFVHRGGRGKGEYPWAGQDYPLLSPKARHMCHRIRPFCTRRTQHASLVDWCGGWVCVVYPHDVRLEDKTHGTERNLFCTVWTPGAPPRSTIAWSLLTSFNFQY